MLGASPAHRRRRRCRAARGDRASRPRPHAAAAGRQLAAGRSTSCRRPRPLCADRRRARRPLRSRRRAELEQARSRCTEVAFGVCRHVRTDAGTELAGRTAGGHGTRTLAALAAPTAGVGRSVTLERRRRAHRPPPGRHADRRATAELLRFRDRLERTDRAKPTATRRAARTDIAVPTTVLDSRIVSGSTISFSRGAPSLDIVDVEGLRDAAERAFESDPAGTTAYGTSVGYLRLRAWIADRHGVDRARARHQRLDAGRRVPVRELVRPGDDVVVERPTYDRTLLWLRERGATCIGRAGARRDRHRRAGRAARRRPARPKLAHIIPNFQNPAGYTLSLAKREALLQLAAPARLPDLRGRPVRRAALQRRAAADDASMAAERRRARRLRHLVLQDRLPGHSRRLPRRPARADRRIAALRDEHVHLAEHGRPVDRLRVLRSAARSSARSRPSARRSPSASTALAGALEAASCPRPSSSRPTAATSCGSSCREGTDVDELFDAAAALGVPFVKGTDFLLEGGENTLRLAYSGVTCRRDRRGRLPPRRRLAVTAGAGSSGRNALGQHELLGQRDALRRRRVGEHRDRLGERRCETQTACRPSSRSTTSLVGLDERAFEPGLELLRP